MRTFLQLLICVFFFPTIGYGQSGTPDDPFTLLDQAQQINTPGIYHFNLDGTPFSTYVLADGYVMVAIDFGDGIGALPQVAALTEGQRGILNPTVLSSLTATESIRMTISTGILDATTTDTSMIGRMRGNLTLMNSSTHNADNDDWKGTGQDNLRRDANELVRDETALNVEVYHTHGDGGGVHWFPQRGDQGLTYGVEIATGESIRLYARAADYTEPPGTSFNPFTQLGQSRTVTAPGVYFFDLDGTLFSTYVDADGYVQVARDFGNGVGTLPGGTDLNETSRGILSAAALAGLTDADEVRLTASVPNTLDAVSFEPTYLDRIVAGRTLMYDLNDNGLNDSWSGTGAGFLQEDATVERSTRPALATEVYHTFGNGAGMTWSPQRDDQAVSFDDGNIADTESLTLWVRAPHSNPRGSQANPFTALSEAALVTTAGRYYFNLDGQPFDTYVDAQGWVRLALDFRSSASGALPASNSPPGSGEGILSADALASLTEMTEARISSSVPDYLDARTSNTGVIGKILANQPIKSDVRDNDINSEWTGTGSTEVNKPAGEGQLNDTYTVLNEEIFHNYFGPNGGEGLHWIPSRGDMALKYQVDIAQGESFMLWGRAAPPCTIAINSVGVTDESCPGAEDGSLDISASCTDCGNPLEFSLNGNDYLVNSTLNGLAPGNYIIYAREQASAGCVVTLPATVAAGVDSAPPVTSPLPPRDLYVCNDGPMTVTPPTANDVCAGTVVATTTDNTTFSSAGNYTVDWVFDDGNGNAVTRREEVTVYGPIYPLPFVETAEVTSTSRACWAVPDLTADGNHWKPVSAPDLAHGGEQVFFLPANGDTGQDDRLETPHFRLSPATRYALDFAYRPLSGGFQEQLSALLLSADDGSIVDTLFYDREDAATTYREINLLFEVPAEGVYKLQFYSLTPPGSNGLLLDDIAVYEHGEPSGGESNLVGAGDDACTTLESYGLYGKAYSRFLNPAGRLALEIDPNGNNLGDVTVEMTDYGQPPLAPANGQYYLSRHFNIEPANGSGPYTLNGGVKVRLYFTAAELAQLNTITGGSLGWGDIVLTHYSGPNEDCDMLNSTGGDLFIEDVETVAAFGGTAYALTFTTTSFSEFGGTNSRAFPVTLRTFTGSAEPQGNRLDWQVDSEVSFSHYAVERSGDGSTFTDIGRVEGAQQPRYSFTDPAPAAAAYYRLRMVDLDGTYAYSQVEYVRRNDSPADELMAYPVPTRGPLTVQYVGHIAGPAYLRVTDALGKLVYATERAARVGEQDWQLDLRHLPPATYQLQLAVGGRVQSLRFVKQ